LKSIACRSFLALVKLGKLCDKVKKGKFVKNAG